MLFAKQDYFFLLLRHRLLKVRSLEGNKAILIAFGRIASSNFVIGSTCFG
jgi:hypothetical protein